VLKVGNQTETIVCNETKKWDDPNMME